MPKSRSKTTVSADEPVDVPFDPASTARGIGIFETGNGLQQGLGAVVVGVIAALIIVPLAWLRSRRGGPRIG